MVTSDEDWVKQAVNKNKGSCRLCRDKMRPRFQELTAKLKKLNASHIGISQVLVRMRELDAGFAERVSESSIRRHLNAGHDPDWRR